jgi:hypothetical protein
MELTKLDLFLDPSISKLDQTACRKASKAASQRCWRASPKGKDYFQGSANVLRVRVWRQAHPGYWRRRRQKLGYLPIDKRADKGDILNPVRHGDCTVQS